MIKVLYVQRLENIMMGLAVNFFFVQALSTFIFCCCCCFFVAVFLGGGGG